MNRYAVFCLLLAFVPFLAICLAVPLWDRIDPLIFGVPFNLAWLIAWIPLTSLCMAGVHYLWRHSHFQSKCSTELRLPPESATSPAEDRLP